MDAAGGRVPRVVRPRPACRSTEFGRRIWGRPDYAPWNLRLLANADGELVGAVHVHLADDAGYVAKIAVRRDHRGRGLAAPMLVDAFRLRPRARRRPLLPLHGHPRRRAHALREGRHGRRLDLGQPRDRPVSRRRFGAGPAAREILWAEPPCGSRTSGAVPGVRQDGAKEIFDVLARSRPLRRPRGRVGDRPRPVRRTDPAGPDRHLRGRARRQHGRPRLGHAHAPGRHVVRRVGRDRRRPHRGLRHGDRRRTRVGAADAAARSASSAAWSA